MFAVEGIDTVVARMLEHGAELIGKMQYENAYSLAYIRRPEGSIVALAEQLAYDATISSCYNARIGSNIAQTKMI